MRRGAGSRHALVGALLLALALLAGSGSVPAAAGAESAPRSVDLHVRVWQDVADPGRLYLSARLAGGRWDALGTVRLRLDEGLSQGRDERFGGVALDGVEIRVFQRIDEPRLIHVSARAAGGEVEGAGRIRLRLDDGLSPGGHYRYGDLALRVPLPPPEQGVRVSPGGDRVPRLAALTASFRHPPPRAGAEALLAVSPPVPGSFAWLDDRTLLFQPDFPGWARGQRYRVTVDAEASGLGSDHVHAFTAEGLLEVAYVIPADGDEEVPAEARVLVQFSRSVAPLTVLQEAGAATVLEFDPPLAGRGEWLSTSLYRFTPEDLRPHTRYTVRVPAAVGPAPDGALAADHAWAFTTVQPAVADIRPQHGAVHVEPDARVVVTFNQPMDRGSVEAGLGLRSAGGEDVPASYSWSEDSTAATLSPAQPLALAAAYTVSAPSGLRGAAGGATRLARQAGFTTVHPPALEETLPRDGDRNAPCCSIRLLYAGPMDEDSFPGRILINGSVLEQDRISVHGRDVYVWGVLDHGSAYTVRLEQGIRDRGGRAPAAHEFSFRTGPPPPGLWFASGSDLAILPAGSPQAVEYHARGAREVSFRLYRLSPQESDALLRRGYPEYGFRPAGPALREWTEPVGGGGQPGSTSPGGGRPLPAGYYYLLAELGGERDRVASGLALGVLDTTIVTKLARGELLAWAVDVASGRPLAGVELLALPAGGALAEPAALPEPEALLETGTLLETEAFFGPGAAPGPAASPEAASARTDGDGLARFALPGAGDVPGDYLVRTAGAGRTGASLTWWDDGAAPYLSGVPFDPGAPGIRGHLYTDRPLYRPGESVFYRGVARLDDDASYSLPGPGLALTLRIRDARYELLEEREVTLSALGTFSGELALPAAAATGSYRVALSGPGGRLVAAASFTVAEFRLPEIRVELEAAADAVSGEQVAARARASFFFGGPVRDAEVAWTALSSPAAFRPAGYDDYSFSEYRESEDPPLRARGEARTDAGGEAAFSVPAVLEEGEGTQEFTLSATVRDESAQAVAGSTTLTVHPAAYYAGIRTGSYVASAGEAVAARLVTLDTAGRAAPGRALTLRLIRREWTTTLEPGGDGDYRYRTELTESEVEALSLATGPAGGAEAALTPPGPGSYRLVAELVDGEGRRQRASRPLWVSGPGPAPWPVRDRHGLELVPDRDRYEVGDVARVLVPSPFAEATGLVTLERGRVLDARVRSFGAGGEVLLVPIEEGHRPNVYVTVVLYRPPTAEDPLPGYRVGHVSLPVSTEPLALDVRVEPGRAEARPGERVGYEVLVTDASGAGVQADLSVAIVDEALLSLGEEGGPDGMAAFWSERPLGVRTASSWTSGAPFGPLAAAEPAAVSDGADLARDAAPESSAGAAERPRARSDFRSTALWLGELRTDAEGRARFEFALPDNATTWRALGRAVTAATQAGDGESSLLVTQPLLVRPALPRFLRAGDEVTLRALVRNGTAEEQEIRVAVEASGLVLEESSPRVLRAGPGDSAEASWTARAASAGTARVRFEARSGGGHADLVETALPVHPDATPETTATGGVVEQGAAVEAVYLPGYALQEAGSLEIALQASLLGDLEQELRFFEPHPWESHERTASRVIATIAASRADGGAPGEARESRVREDLARLAAAQRPDGGWGWCRDCPTNIWVTGWVLAALGEARAAGYDVPAEGYERTAGLIARHLGRGADVERPRDPNQAAFLLHALAGAAGGAGDLDRELSAALDRLVATERSQLASWGRAYALLGLLAAGRGPDDASVRALLNDLAASAVSSATGSHWEDEPISGCMHNSSVRATALVLRALTEAAPGHPLLEETARWLVRARQAGRWTTSVERAQGMASLGAYAELTGEVRGAYGYRVLVNGRPVLDGRFDAAAGDRADGVALPLERLPGGEVSRVQLGRGAGEGRLYYGLALRYLTPAREAEALARGFALSRSYSLLDEPETAVTSAPAGEIVRVRVTVVAPADRLFARVEDALPAGLEPVDPRLDIVPEWLRQQLAREQEEARRSSRPAGSAPWYPWYYSPWDQVDLRDDRVVLLATRLPAGVHEYVYYARATTPGDFFAAPARAEESYFPEVFGRSDSGRFTVADGAGEAR